MRQRRERGGRYRAAERFFHTPALRNSRGPDQQPSVLMDTGARAPSPTLSGALCRLCLFTAPSSKRRGKAGSYQP